VETYIKRVVKLKASKNIWLRNAMRLGIFSFYYKINYRIDFLKSVMVGHETNMVPKKSETTYGTSNLLTFIYF
jgi:hypothetical protein